MAGALTATAAIVLPSFAFVAVLGPLLPRARRNYYARAALIGMNAAFVALIFVAGRFAVDLWPGGFRLASAGASLTVLLRWNVNATWLLLACAAAGLWCSAWPS